VRWLACHPGPHFSVADVHAGWAEALRTAGEKVVEYPLGDSLTFYSSVLMQVGPNMFARALDNDQATSLAVDRLCGALYKVRPDVLLLTSGFFLPPTLFDVVRRDGVRVVLLATEQPYELGRELDLAAHCDVVLLNDPTHLAKFQEVTTARYQPHSYRPSVHCPGPADPALACDLAFVGTGYASRIDFLERMDLTGLAVRLAGNWQQLAAESPLRPYVAQDELQDCLDNVEAVKLYRSAKVGINLYRREAERPELAAGYSVGPREIEMAACGLFFLRDPRPEGDRLFPMLPTFTSPAEANSHLRWFLAHPAARETAAAKAREAIADRTFDHAAAALLRLLDG
jgi:spore maturation protein CgeB